MQLFGACHMVFAHERNGNETRRYKPQHSLSISPTLNSTPQDSLCSVLFHQGSPHRSRTCSKINSSRHQRTFPSLQLHTRAFLHPSRLLCKLHSNVGSTTRRFISISGKNHRIKKNPIILLTTPANPGKLGFPSSMFLD